MIILQFCFYFAVPEVPPMNGSQHISWKNQKGKFATIELNQALWKKKKRVNNLEPVKKIISIVYTRINI